MSMRLYVYQEDCIMAGQAVPARILEQRQERDGKPTWFVVEGTEDELIERARSEIRQANTDNQNSQRFHRRVARTILEALRWSEEEIDEEIYGK